ncbi:MAG: polysaccharide biosynthesis/export family protein [Chitinophagaceae bacterium]
MFNKIGFNTVLREYAWLLLLCIAGTSCTNTKKVIYFPGVEDGKIVTESMIPESVIQKSDILSITVGSLNPEASQVFNTTAAGAGTLNSNGGGGDGYLVNTDGYIQFPLLGNIKAEGLNKKQLKKILTDSILSKQLLVDPIISIRFLNFRITVLGEVRNPGVVTVPNEKVSLLEAIGLAGDLTLYAKRENVLVIREEKDEKIFKRINLNSSEIFTSPYYYLKSNDIIYVEPNKAKVATTNRSNQWLPIFFSGLSLAALLADRIINK